MRTYRWLTLGAAIAITALETWLFVGTSALASQPAVPAAQPNAAGQTAGPFGAVVDPHSAHVASERG